MSEVAPTSTGKAEPNLTEVIITSAPKHRAVQRLGAHLCALEKAKWSHKYPVRFG